MTAAAPTPADPPASGPVAAEAPVPSPPVSDGSEEADGSDDAHASPPVESPAPQRFATWLGSRRPMIDVREDAPAEPAAETLADELAE